jgi:Tol biopolymer transport system component
MRTRILPVLLAFITFLLCACAGDPAVDSPYSPGFFYLSFASGSSSPSLILQNAPNSAIRSQFALDPPTDCSFYALRPAPRGRWVAVEWECAFGPAVEMFDTASGKSHFALSDPTIDSRFLAWQPDGRQLYLKIGTLSVPQTLRVDAATGKATELPISPFVYDLTVTPDGSRVYYALTKGLGFGSEAWLAGPEGQNPSQLLVDAQNIIALAQYSPDGSQIAFIKFPDNQSSTPPGELWVMDSSGFHDRKLAVADAGRGFAPVWSPAGDRLALAGRDQPAKPETINISVAELKSSVLTSYPTAPSTQPVWSPDGTLIAFSTINTSIQSTQGDTMELWFYKISSGKGYKLVTDACCAGWIR